MKTCLRGRGLIAIKSRSRGDTRNTKLQTLNGFATEKIQSTKGKSSCIHQEDSERVNCQSEKSAKYDEIFREFMLERLKKGSCTSFIFRGRMSFGFVPPIQQGFFQS